MKAITEQTLSPWKIRVTVEAEPENGPGQGHIRTRTYQIPLKPCSSPLEAITAGRGRVKKAPQSSPARKKRSGTPVGGRNRRNSVTDLNITVLGDEEEADEWSPRKKAAAKRRPTRPSTRSSVTPQSVKESEDMYSAPGDEREPYPSHESLREIDLNRVSVRPRSASTRAKDRPQPPSEVATQEDVASPAEASVKGRAIQPRGPGYPTPSPTPSVADGLFDDDHPIDMNEGQGLDTVLESEGFTMIDLESIPSVRRVLSSPFEDHTPARNDSIADTVKDQQTVQTSNITNTVLSDRSNARSGRSPRNQLILQEDDTEFSSNVGSSPPTNSRLLGVPQRSFLNRRVTPDTYSSPKLPSPPKQPRKDETLPPPRRVVHAGNALQEVVSSPASEPHIQQLTPNSTQDNFLDGFSSGTKRELRAGLRFGEELAKRSSPMVTSELSSTAKSVHHGVTQDPTKAISDKTRETSLCDDGHQTKTSSTANGVPMKQPEQPSLSFERPNERDEVGYGNVATPGTRQESSPQVEYPTLDRRQAQREHEWQLEREAVSRQIQAATPSKVILIDSSFEAESDEEDSEEYTEQAGGRALGLGTSHHIPSKFGIGLPDFAEEAGRSGQGHAQASPGAAAKKSRESSCDDRQISKSDEARLQTQHEDYQSHDLGFSREEEGKAHPGAQTKPVSGTQQGGARPVRPFDCQEEPSFEDEKDVDDDFGEAGDETDIWLQEARESSSSPREEAKSDNLQPQAQPRRGLIPSPWKRGEQVDETTMITNGDMSGVLWQQPLGNRFGATELARQTKRASENHFDVDRMRSSPVKEAFSGRNNLKLRAPYQEPSYADESVEESSQADIEDETTQSSLRSPTPQATRIPVNFNDSSMIAGGTSPPSSRDSREEVAHPRIPATRPGLGARRTFSGSVVPESIEVPPAHQEIGFGVTHSSDKEVEANRSQTVQIGLGIITPPSTRSSEGEVRPPTPRSAMKGGRGEASPTKRVVFNERSRYLNEHGEESTMSANFDSPQPTITITQPHIVPETEHEQDKVPPTGMTKSSSWSSWLWRGKDEDSQSSSDPSIKDDSSNVSIKDSGSDNASIKSASSSVPIKSSSSNVSIKKRSPSETPTQDIIESPESAEGTWARTKTSLCSRPLNQPTPTHTIRPPKPPTYLLFPSYPSVAKRSLATPLMTSGSFSNDHFRTLHILHAKSMRPDFHAPKFIRPEIDALLGMKVVVDESKAGLDVFEWSVGVNECEVLERFCREVEWGHVSQWAGKAWKDMREATAMELGPNGIVPVKVLQMRAIESAVVRESKHLQRHNGLSEEEVQERAKRMLNKMSKRSGKKGEREIKAYWEAMEVQGMDIWTVEMKKVGWGWTMKELMHWLGMVVIGEVVRRDEALMLAEANAAQ